MDGVIIVDKPQGWTSHDVVGKMRRIAGTKKIGHLGTLDPMATGVLPLVLNRATRLAQFFLKNDKAYEGEIVFGWATSTYDAEGDDLGERREMDVTPAMLEPHLAAFRGTFAQTPPPVSAKKIGGVPAYKLARKDKPVELTPVTVTVSRLEVLACEGNRARVVVECGGGTYVRAIAHDLGVALGCGAHLGALRRTRAGDFGIAQARTIAELEALREAGRLEEALIPSAQLLPEFPVEPVDVATVAQIRQGRAFRVSPFRVRMGTRLVKAVSEDGELVAIGQAKLPNLYHPILVF
jgi:tRNA pseudouridine55 synthase